METFDAIIVGAGLSGLSLAARMVERQPDARLAIVDADFDPPDHKLWSWWDRADRVHAPFPEVPRTTWTSMRVAARGWERVEPLGTLAYATMRSEAFRSIVSGTLRERGVSFVSGRVQGLVDVGPLATVALSDRTLAAPHVFQSMALSPRDRARPVRYPLRQHFGGWVVRAESAPFDPGTFTLMDFDVEAVPGALAFLYVLPFSETDALFEYTLFSPRPLDRAAYDAALEGLVRRRVEGPWRVLRTEHGVLPMEERLVEARWSERIFNLGAVGGALKASTGYAFARIQRQSEHLARTWAAGAPEPLPRSAERFTLYDTLLLRVLLEEPEAALPLFETLFQNTRFETVLRFLDERTSLLDEARLFAGLPWGPFVRGALPEVGRWAWRPA